MRKHIYKALLFLIICTCFLARFSYSQSPYYTIKFSVTDASSGGYVYTIAKQVCEFDYKPVINSGDYWFGRDTSTLNWNNLPDSMYTLLKCGDESVEKGMVYEDSNQSMVWENIYRFRIIRRKAETTAASDTMTIVFPVLLKAFVTFINLGSIPFTPGYYEPIYDFKYSQDNHMSMSLPEGYPWKSILYEERKIRLN